MDKISIHYITHDDIEGFRRTLGKVAAEKRYILTTEIPPLEKLQPFVENNIKQNHAQYLAKHQGTVIGWADISPHDHPTMAHVGVLGMGIVEGYRGQGLGKRLLETTINHAWQQGLERVELQVFADNPAAIRLYEKMGFQREGLKPKARKVDGVYQDIVDMGMLRQSV
ncbi:MAG: GNAT family N-acetyltransferase [Gammaproteobacteria bacterium]|nr:GNAT family N-acetyltransferase [Gammaproteobacteria bacterium]